MTRMRIRTRWLAACLLVVPLSASPQETITETSPPPREAPLPSSFLQREEVRFVTLDLIAEKKTKGQWRRVQDLTAKRVKVFVAGQPMTFDVFEDWCGGSTSQTMTVEDAAGDAGEAAGAPTRYILYFDLQHLKTAGLHAAFRAARTWATDRFLPDDEVMIITGSLGFRIVRQMRPASDGLLEDLEIAQNEYREASRWADGEGNEATGRFREILDLVEFEKGMTPVQAGGMAASFVAQETVYERRSLRNLQDLMALFESVEGTKNLIIFQETIRMYPGRQYPLATPVETVNMEPFLRGLSRAANERNVRIYPVDAGGMDGEGDEALYMLAGETGGRFYTRSNDLAPAFELLREDASCFYRIGFRVEPRFSGTVDRIRVEIDGPRMDPKYRKRHRRTLTDPTREQRDADRIRAALLDPDSASAFPLWVSAIPLLEHPDGARVRLQVSAAFKELLMIPTGVEGPPTSQVLVQVGGAVVPLRQRPDGDETVRRSILYEAATDRPPWQFARQALLELPHGDNVGPGAGRYMALAREIDVPPGRYRFVAVVQDRLAGVLGAGSIDFEVGGEVPVVGDVRLAVEDPRMYFLQSKPDEERDPTRKLRKDEIGMAPPVLPEDTFLRTKPNFRSEPAGSLVYGLCDPASAGSGAFDGWELRRSLSCNGESVEQAEAPRSLHPAGASRACAIVINPLPVELMEPGLCKYSITAVLPDGRTETRSLEFHVLGIP